MITFEPFQGNEQSENKQIFIDGAFVGKVFMVPDSSDAIRFHAAIPVANGYHLIQGFGPTRVAAVEDALTMGIKEANDIYVVVARCRENISELQADPVERSKLGGPALSESVCADLDSFE